MANIKHIGRIKTNKRRAIIAYRTLPNDPYSALVILTESLPADEHDALIKLVESPSGQQAEELALAMQRTYLPDGRNMLAGFHTTGQLKKVPTSDIEMTPNQQSSILLSDLNQVIAQQKGVALEDLAVKPTNAQPVAKKVEPEVVSEMPFELPLIENVAVAPTPVTPEDMATQLRSHADAMFKEAKRLREQAEELVPTIKKTTKASAKEIAN
tara:strand:+ start:709 stop:1344 length:636 start_codon:yes stop_codon:yes gene_type:complete